MGWWANLIRPRDSLPPCVYIRAESTAWVLRSQAWESRAPQAPWDSEAA